MKPGGTLFQLPQEVRDEIYRHYFNKEYRVLWCYYNLEDCNIILADLAILRTSKTISSDATNSLFSRAASKAIVFTYNFDLDPIAKMSTPPTKEATKRMMNVVFKVSIERELRAYRTIIGRYADETLSPASSMGPIYEATIDHFTGISVVRDRLRIRLYAQGYRYYEAFLKFMKTRFFQTLKRMQGFRKLNLVLEMLNIFKDDLSIDDQQDLGEVVAELEPYLGPCIVKRMTHGCGDWVHVVYDLEFQPLKRQIESLQVEVAESTKEVRNSRDSSSE